MEKKPPSAKQVAARAKFAAQAKTRKVAKMFKPSTPQAPAPNQYRTRKRI